MSGASGFVWMTNLLSWHEHRLHIEKAEQTASRPRCDLVDAHLGGCRGGRLRLLLRGAGC